MSKELHPVWHRGEWPGEAGENESGNGIADRKTREEQLVFYDTGKECAQLYKAEDETACQKQVLSPSAIHRQVEKMFPYFQEEDIGHHAKEPVHEAFYESAFPRGERPLCLCHVVLRPKNGGGYGEKDALLHRDQSQPQDKESHVIQLRISKDAVGKANGREASLGKVWHLTDIAGDQFFTDFLIKGLYDIKGSDIGITADDDIAAISDHEHLTLTLVLYILRKSFRDHEGSAVPSFCLEEIFDVCQIAYPVLPIKGIAGRKIIG